MSLHFDRSCVIHDQSLCFIKVKREVGDITILINNAGIVTGKKFMESPDSLIEKSMEVNSLAHFWVCILSIHPSIHPFVCLFASK